MYGMHCYIICQRERQELNIHDTVFRSLLLKHGWKNVFLTQEHCERFLTLWFPWCPCRISPKLCMAFLGLWSIKKNLFHVSLKTGSSSVSCWLLLKWIEISYICCMFSGCCVWEMYKVSEGHSKGQELEKSIHFFSYKLFFGACTFLVKDFFSFPVLH